MAKHDDLGELGPDGLEAWQCAIPGRVMIRKYALNGEVRTELVASGRVIHLTPTERKLNQEVAISEDLDVFLNGAMQPVRLLEDGEDSEAIATHPNHLTETQARRLFKGAAKNLVERLAQITNRSAVERLLELAEDPATGASYQQHQLITARLKALDPEVDLGHVKTRAPARDGRPEIDTDVSREGVPRAVTPG